jgi:Fic family protein
MSSLESYNSGTALNQGDFKSFKPSLINKIWTWQDSELNFLLSQANKELGGLNTYSELIPDIDIYIRMHIRTEANKSSKIEGTKTSIEEDMMGVDEVAIERRDDVQEVNNYIDSMNHGIKRILEDEFPLTSRLMREMHEILLTSVRGEHKTPGEFRKSQNFIGGTMPSNAKFVPPSIIDMPELISDLDKFINNVDGMPELIKIAMIHYQFETIHPFLDGNGRIGRLIVPLYLLSKKELQKPCFYISDFFEKNRMEYYDKLQSVRDKSDMIGWIKFFLTASIETAKLAKSKFKNAVSQVESYSTYLISKKSSADSLQRIITSMYSYPVTNTNELSEITKLTPQAINKSIRILLEDKVLMEITGNRRNRIFALHEYINVFK